MRSLALILTLLLLVSCRNSEVKPRKSKIVLSQIPIAVSLLQELTKGTEIEVIALADSDMTINELADNSEKKGDILDSLAPLTSAVVGMHSIMTDDKLYIAVRNRNIRAVEIDLATSQNLKASSIGTIKEQGNVNPYIWLSIANVMQMSEIVHLDLVALFPNEGATITSNHKKLHKALKTLKNSYEKKFLSLPRFEAATMDNSFDYLIQDINLFVMKRFSNETTWTVKDKKEYERSVKTGTYGTIIHRWEPLSSISNTAKDAGVSFTVLNTGFPQMEHFDQGLLPFMESNLEKLIKNLEKK